MKRLTTIFMLLPLVLVTACSRKNSLNDKTLVVGCSPTPHAKILEAAKPLFEEKGYKLDIKVLNDYVTPNTLLDSEDLDANYFQHVPYLEDFNAKNKTNLSWITKVHFEPMGIYSKKHSSLVDTLGVKVAVPNDTSNYARAIDLLEKTISTLGIEIIQMEAQAIPSVLNDVDYGVINGNYALSANITDKCLAAESSDSETANELANVIAVKTSSLNYEWVQVIKEVFTSSKMRDFINTEFGSSVKAVF